MKDLEQQHTESVWQRLRINREKNADVLLEAGIRPELGGKVICPDCGAEEDVLFWSILSRKGTRLRLLCPVCEEARVNFNLAKNRPVDPVFTRGTVGGGLGMIALIAAVGLLFYYRDTPEVQRLATEAYVVRDAVAGGAGRAASGAAGAGGSGPVQPAASRGGGGGGSTSGSSSGGTARSGGGGGSSSGSSGGNAASSGSRVPSATTSSRPVTGLPMPSTGAEEGSAGLVYVARGDRRGDVDMYTAEVIQRRGTGEANLLLSVQYDSARNETRVVVDSASVEWPRRLGWLRGWRRAD